VLASPELTVSRDAALRNRIIDSVATTHGIFVLAGRVIGENVPRVPDGLPIRFPTEGHHGFENGTGKITIDKIFSGEVYGDKKRGD
jgi:hypothetical protein